MIVFECLKLDPFQYSYSHLHSHLVETNTLGYNLFRRNGVHIRRKPGEVEEFTSDERIG